MASERVAFQATAATLRFPSPHLSGLGKRSVLLERGAAATAREAQAARRANSVGATGAARSIGAGAKVVSATFVTAMGARVKAGRLKLRMDGPDVGRHGHRRLEADGRGAPGASRGAPLQ